MYTDSWSEHQHSIGVLVQVLAPPLPIWRPRGPCIHVQNLEGIPVSQLQTKPSLAAAAMWGVNQTIEDLFLYM